MVFGKVYLVFGKVYLVFELLGVALVWGLGLGSMILPSSSSCCCWWSPTAVSQAATVASRAAGAEKIIGHCKKSWQRIFYVGFILSQPISNCWSKSLAIVDSSAHVCCINTSFCVHTISSLYLSIIVVFTQTSGFHTSSPSEGFKLRLSTDGEVSSEETDPQMQAPLMRNKSQLFTLLHLRIGKLYPNPVDKLLLSTSCLFVHLINSCRASVTLWRKIHTSDYECENWEFCSKKRRVNFTL